MDFSFRRFDTHRQHNHVFRSVSPSSSSNYNYFSDQAMNEGLWSGRSVTRGPVAMREAIERELEKERIREEIKAEEIERRRVLEAEVRRELMIEQEVMRIQSSGGFPSLFFLDPPRSHHNRFESDMLHGQSFAPAAYGGSGRHRHETEGYEVVPFQRLPSSPKIKEITTYPPADRKKEIIGLGNPFGTTISGTKRKPPLAAAGSSRVCSNKKIEEEWSCAVCEISATSEHGLNEHLAGKKHIAKMESLKPGNNINGAEIGFGKMKNTVSIDSKKHQKTEGGDHQTRRQKLKLWCKLCLVEVVDEKMMRNHRNGKKHLKNLRKKTTAETKLGGGSKSF